MNNQKTAQLSSTRWQPSAPLWQRAPHTQADGASLADLMMLIPGLKRYTEGQSAHLQRKLEAVIEEFGERVVFADINLKLNVIWITVLPEPGLCREVAVAIRKRIPEAVMVGNQLKSTTTEIQTNGWPRWIFWMKRIVSKARVKALPHRPTE